MKLPDLSIMNPLLCMCQNFKIARDQERDNIDPIAHFFKKLPYNLNKTIHMEIVTLSWGPNFETNYDLH